MFSAYKRLVAFWRPFGGRRCWRARPLITRFAIVILVVWFIHLYECVFERNSFNECICANRAAPISRGTLGRSTLIRQIWAARYDVRYRARYGAGRRCHRTSLSPFISHQHNHQPHHQETAEFSSEVHSLIILLNLGRGLLTGTLFVYRSARRVNEV